jgi:uncharacterized membrane protein YhaH (DUF805 family)
MMSFAQAVRSALGSYATFAGRSRRSEYWWFYLFTLLVGAVASGIDALLNTVIDNPIGIVGLVTSLGILLPSWAVAVRRLHDTGRTGWWMAMPLLPLLGLVLLSLAVVPVLFFSFDTNGRGPLIGLVAALMVLALLTISSIIVLLVFFCQDSRPGPNRYGPSPKEPAPLAGPYGYYPPYSPGEQAPPT